MTVATEYYFWVSFCVAATFLLSAKLTLVSRPCQTTGRFLRREFVDARVVSHFRLVRFAVFVAAPLVSFITTPSEPCTAAALSLVKPEAPTRAPALDPPIRAPAV